MRDCGRVMRLLSGYLDGESSASDRLRVEKHLQECPACRRELSFLSRAKESVSGGARKSLPPDYMVSRLKEEIRKRERAFGRELSWLSGMGSLSRRLIPVPVTAVLLSLIFLFSVLPGQGEDNLLEDRLLKGGQVTVSTALGLVLGVQE